MKLVTVGACLVLACAAGCGSSSKSSSSTQSTTAGGPAPANLVGVYTMKLTNKDLASNHAPELKVARSWKLRIDKGRLTITNVQAGALEAPQLAVSGDRALLKQEECAA